MIPGAAFHFHVWFGSFHFHVIGTASVRFFSQDHAEKEYFIRCAFLGVFGHSLVPWLHGWELGGSRV